MALIDGLGGSKRWNRWLSVVDRVALSAWNTQTHKEIIQLDCIFEQYEAVLGPLIERQNITICMDGTVQIDDKTYYLSKSRIYNFFDEIRINIGSEKTYKPFLCGGCSS